MLHKHLPLEDCRLDIKSASGKPTVFTGYASVFGRVDAVGDTVTKGAFEESISDRAPLMFFGHNPGRIIGKWVDAKEDDIGLKVKGELTPGHRDAEDVAASLKHGTLSGLSIGFRIPEGGAEKTETGRILKAVDLVEVSVVAMPAEDAARIDMTSVKHYLDDFEKLSDFEDWLREAAGFSKSTATAFVARLSRIARGEPERKQESEIERLLRTLESHPIPTLE